MKKRLVFVAILLGFASLAFADPKILVPEQSWDFGHIPQQSTISHAYWVKNVGTDTLKIIKVKPG